MEKKNYKLIYIEQYYKDGTQVGNETYKETITDNESAYADALTMLKFFAKNVLPQYEAYVTESEDLNGNPICVLSTYEEATGRLRLQSYKVESV